MISNITFKSDDNYISSLYETYSFEYDLFLAESDTFNTLNKIDNASLQEAYLNEAEMITESIKETLTLWLTRFTEAIQKAFNKFMSVIEGAKDTVYLKSIESQVKALDKDPGFSVSNVRNYNDDAIKNFKVVDFQQVYNTNKDSLQTQEKFLIANYSDYGFADGQTDIKDTLEKSMVNVVDEANITIDNIKGYYEWCRTNYNEDINPIRQQINQYNTSIKSISNLISQMPDDFRNPVQTANNPTVTQNTTQDVNSAYIFSGNIIIEADNDTQTTGTTNSISGTQSAVNTNQQDNDQMKFNDKVDKVAKVGGENQEVVVATKTYLSCTARLLQTIFQIIKNRKADYIRILKHLFPAGKDMQNVDQSNITAMTINDKVPSVKL